MEAQDDIGFGIIIGSILALVVLHLVIHLVEKYIEWRQKEIGCKCSNEESFGSTQVHCCNRCGKPTEDWWTGDYE